MNPPLLLNSLALAAGATLAAVATGFLAGLALTAIGGRARWFGLAATVAALAMPPFLAVNCWLDLLGAQGLLRPWLPAAIKIYSLPGALWVMALLLWPLSALAAWSAWRRLTVEQLEAEPLLRGFTLVRWLLWPSARRSLGLAAALTFILALNHFSVPALLQVKVLPAEVWVEFNTRLDNLAALRAGWPLLAASAVLVWWLCRGAEIPWPRQCAGVMAVLFRRQLGWPTLSLAASVTILALFFSVLLPLIELLGGSRSWEQWLSVPLAGWRAAWNSLWLAAAAATLTTALGILAALVQWRRGRGSARGIGAVAWLGFFVPGILLGVLLIFLLNRQEFNWLYGGFGILVLALLLRYLGPGGHGAFLALQGVDRDLLDAGQLAGASGWRLFAVAAWPQAAPQIAAAWYAVYLLCLWDVETLVLIQPPGGETLALRVFNLLHYGHTEHVNAICLWLLALAVAPLLFWLIWHGWRRGSFFRAAVSLASVLLLSACQPDGDSLTAPIKSRYFEYAQVIGERGSAPGQFSKPRSVEVDLQDNLYVVDMTGRVQKFSPDGHFLLSWQMPETDLGKAKGLGRDKQGNIIVIEPHYQRLNHFSPEGKLVRQWGVRGTNEGQFILPRAVAVSSKGNLYVSDYTLVDRVQGFDGVEKRLLACWGRAGGGLGEFNRAEGLGMDNADRLHVADSCNHRIQVFDSSGRFLRLYGKPGVAAGELSYPYDVRVDPAGLHFVCEFGNSRIQVFDAQGRSLEIIGGPGMAPGKFNNPWGIALDSKGNLYVADAGNHRVQKLIRRRRLVKSSTVRYNPRRATA